MMRLPSCVGKSHKEIWQEFKTLYPELPESQLREIHLRWVRAYAEATR